MLSTEADVFCEGGETGVGGDERVGDVLALRYCVGEGLLRVADAEEGDTWDC